MNSVVVTFFFERNKFFKKMSCFILSNKIYSLLLHVNNLNILTIELFLQTK